MRLSLLHSRIVPLTLHYSRHGTQVIPRSRSSNEILQTHDLQLSRQRPFLTAPPPPPVVRPPRFTGDGRRFGRSAGPARWQLWSSKWITTESTEFRLSQGACSLVSRRCRSNTTPGNNQIKHVERDLFILIWPLHLNYGVLIAPCDQ
jgi:hypothetical protein